jgi:hypothetical protein
MSENVKPRFQIEKLKGKRDRRIAKPKVQLDDKGNIVLDKDGNSKLLGGFDYEDINVDAGWMVYFPSGSSIHVWTKEEMDRQGFLDDPRLVNLDTGDDAGPTDSPDLKKLAERADNRADHNSRNAQR